MKRFVTLLLGLFILLAISACEAEGGAGEESNPNPEDLVLLDGGNDYTAIKGAVGLLEIARSKEGHYVVYREYLTDFMYFSYNGDPKSSAPNEQGVAPLFDPETSAPLTWERFLELSK